MIAAAILSSSMWLTVSDWSHHMNRARTEILHLNERNAGAGFEADITRNWGAVGGYYVNSFNKSSWYAGTDWMPIQEGNFRFGIQAGIVSGYSKFYGGMRPYVAPVLEYNKELFGVNVLFIPPASDVGGGVLTLQLKWKMK